MKQSVRGLLLLLLLCGVTLMAGSTGKTERLMVEAGEMFVRLAPDRWT